VLLKLERDKQAAWILVATALPRFVPSEKTPGHTRECISPRRDLDDRPRAGRKYYSPKAIDVIIAQRLYFAVAWTVIFHPDFDAEFAKLPQQVREDLSAHALTLQALGPTAKRPLADTLDDSEHANMKELRFKADDGVWRVRLRVRH
jgi:hypothetical protein